MLAVLQILYFDMHNGRKRTPLHVINGQSIHSTCKSSTLVKSFNHLGLSVSYEELLRYHNDMANLIVDKSQDNVPLPSHFDSNMYTTAAFDNFDHEEATASGIGGSHVQYLCSFKIIRMEMYRSLTFLIVMLYVAPEPSQVNYHVKR